jgi:hypothetical protein
LEPLHVAVVLVVASVATSLNPVLKLDGYWLVADALGVTNLGRQPRTLARWLLARATGRSDARPLAWPRAVGAALAVHAVASVVVWAVVLRAMGRAVVSVAGRCPRLVASLVEHATARSWPPSAELGELATSTFLLAFVAAMAWQVAGPVLAWSTRMLPRPARAPGARTTGVPAASASRGPAT